MAQKPKAPALGAGDRGCESHHPDHFIIKRAREGRTCLLFQVSADNTGFKILYKISGYRIRAIIPPFQGGDTGANPVTRFLNLKDTSLGSAFYCSF